MTELNKAMKEIAERYCKKNNHQIKGEEFYEYGYVAIIENNRKIICNTMNIERATRSGGMYMKIMDSDGKQKRIPNREW